MPVLHVLKLISAPSIRKRPPVRLTHPSHSTCISAALCTYHSLTACFLPHDIFLLQHYICPPSLNETERTDCAPLVQHILDKLTPHFHLLWTHTPCLPSNIPMHAEGFVCRAASLTYCTTNLSTLRLYYLPIYATTIQQKNNLAPAGLAELEHTRNPLVDQLWEGFQQLNRLTIRCIAPISPDIYQADTRIRSRFRGVWCMNVI